MTNSGIEAATLAPAVGFDFKFRVEDGTDLVLYADKPSFVSLIEDPASGIDDPNVTEMAAYFDAVEAASSPENPMARLINMLRFLPDEKVLGETLMRLTPHYAVHSFALMNRATDAALDARKDASRMAIRIPVIASGCRFRPASTMSATTAPGRPIQG